MNSRLYLAMVEEDSRQFRRVLTMYSTWILALDEENHLPTPASEKYIVWDFSFPSIVS